MEVCEEVAVTLRLLLYIRLVILSHTKHSHSSEKGRCCVCLVQESHFIEGQGKLHEDIF